MNHQTLLATPEDYGLLTDLYQLTMAACYVGKGLISVGLALSCLLVNYLQATAI
jgi:hypothetical protein